MSPVRALFAARIQVLWNLAHRGTGVAGTLAAFFITALALGLLIPPFVMFFKFGMVLGEDMPAAESPAMIWLSGLHLLILIGMGSAAGLRHQAGFDQDLLRQFPLRPVQILLAELPFNLIDTIPVLGFTFYAGLGTGLIRAQPASWLHAVLAVAGGMLGILLVQQMVGASRRLVSRSRALAVIAGLIALLVVAFLVLLSRHGLAEALTELVAWLPITASFSGFRAATRGEMGLAWMLQAAGLAFTLALFAVTVRLQLAELDQDPALRLQTGGATKPWTFREPAQGLARLFVEQVVGARHGKLLMVLPLFCCLMFVLAADILRRSGAGADETGFQATVGALFARAQDVPLYLWVQPLAVMLFNKELWLNQFAWNGGGVKTLLLAPVRTRDILRGNLMGLLLLQVPQGLVACAPLARLRGPVPFELLTGLAAALLAGVVLATFGHVASARYPRALVGREERAEGLPPLLMLASTGIIVALGATILVVVRIAGGFSTWAPAAMLGALAAVALLAHRVAMPLLTASVDDSRETLAETLG